MEVAWFEWLRRLAEIGLARWTKMEAAAFHVKNLHRLKEWEWHLQ